MSEKKDISRSSMAWIIGGAILLSAFMIMQKIEVSDSSDPFAKCETLMMEIFGNQLKCRAEIAGRRLAGSPY